MNFGIDTPWYQDPMEYAAFNAYAYHQQHIEDFITILSRFDDPNDLNNQIIAADAALLDLNSITTSEAKYIANEVTKRKYDECT